MDLHTNFVVQTPVIVLAEGAFGQTDGKTTNGVTIRWTKLLSPMQQIWIS